MRIVAGRKAKWHFPVYRIGWRRLQGRSHTSRTLCLLGTTGLPKVAVLTNVPQGNMATQLRCFICAVFSCGCPGIKSLPRPSQKRCFSPAFGMYDLTILFPCVKSMSSVFPHRTVACVVGPIIREVLWQAPTWETCRNLGANRLARGSGHVGGRWWRAHSTLFLGGRSVALNWAVLRSCRPLALVQLGSACASMT